MSFLKRKVNIGYQYLKSYSFLIEIGISLAVLLIILSHLFGLGEFLENSQNLILLGLYQFFLMISMVLTVLFLPFFPIFYWFPKRFQIFTKYKPLEKLAFTIIFNMCAYIIIGYFSGMTSIPITGFFFYLNVIIIYAIQIILYISITLKKGITLFNTQKSPLSEEKGLFKEFSIMKLIKTRTFINSLFLGIFVLLICFLDVVRTSIFTGTDPWFHITIIKIITQLHFIPYNAYLGAMGLHIYSSVIYFFSGIEIILIPKLFVFYTFPVSAIIVYNIFRRVFKNQNLVILGVFLLEFTSIGFSIIMYQFWPSSISFLMCLTLFQILLVRLKYLIKKEKEKKLRYFPLNSTIDYILMGIFFLASIFTHSLITVILLCSYLFVFFIYFLKNRRVGQDFIILCGLALLFFILDLLHIGSGHFNIFDELRATPFVYFLAGVIGGGLLIGIIAWKLKQSITLHNGSYKAVIKGEKYGYYKKFEDKYFLRFTLIIVIVVTVIFFVINMLYFNFRLVTILTSMETTIVVIFCIWGIVLFQKKPKGKIFFIWALGLALLFGIGFLFDFLIGVLKLWSRIFYLSSPVIMIGFISYIYKIIQTNQIRKLDRKLFLIIFIGFSLIATFLEEANSINVFDVSPRDRSTILWYTNYTNSQNVIISEFGWDTALIYYDLPYYENNTMMDLTNISSYYLNLNKTYSDPNLHFNANHQNILKQLKSKYKTNVFLITDKYYLNPEGWNFFINMTKHQLDMYYNLSYLNRVCISVDQNGGETPYYWVI